MTKNKLLLLLVLLTMLSTRAVAQNDASAMRAQMKERLDELKDLAPENVKGLNQTLKNDTVKVFTAQYTQLYNASPLESYEAYQEAYDFLGHIIFRVNEYLAAYKEFTDNMAKLKTLIQNFNADTEKKQEYITFAQDVYNAYKALSAHDMIALTNENVAAQKEYNMFYNDYEPTDVTSDNIADVDDRPEECLYISTYGQFNAFFSQNNKELGSIYLKVAGTGTAESPEDLTAQLRNPNLENAGEQWWGTDWTAFGNNLAEHRGNNTFDTYQMVRLPQGYYTLVGYGMDRRGSWADVLANDEDWNEYQRTELYAIMDYDGYDTTRVDAFKAKNMALTADITNGAGNISTCEVGGVTYYTPNDMAQYRAWEDAKIAMTGHGHGAVLQFRVYGDDFGKLGFAHRWPIDNTWFVADGIQLYYAKDNYPDINIDTPITPAATTYSVTMAEGTEEAENWKVKVGEGEAQDFPVEGLNGGETVIATYSGEKKVKSVKAVKVAAVNPNAYLKWDADQKKLVATEIPTTATKVENADAGVEWQAGTYVVEGEDVKINGSITLNGTVDLIIKDGAKLTAQRISGNMNNLSIYGQANQTGQLVVNSSTNDAISGITTFEVHSAKVSATTSSSNRGGFFYIGTINVYGGSVDATATGDGCGINLNGSMDIYGGEVKAVGKGTRSKSYGLMSGSTSSTVTVYGGKLWAQNADDKALKYINIQKGTGFTGKIETSDDGSSWDEYDDEEAFTTKYVRVGYN